jgi:peroxidase
MRIRKQKERSLRARKSLSIEHLEPREMMAADTGLAALSAVPLSNTVDVSSPTLDVMAQSASRSRFNPQPIIPTTTVPPRSIDGTGNNLTNTELGSTGEQLLREAPAGYGNGVDSLAGADRPSPRVISDALAAHGADDTPSDRQLSAYIYVWGQFLDHDIDLTEPPTSNQETANIAVPTGDTSFDPTGTGTQTIAFTRSRFDATTGTSTDNPRQQINEITSWIDGSMVYGSDQATADSLRTFSGGKLLTSAGNMLPMDAAGNYLAGDVRANENIELTSMQTLFVREHNYWAGKIATANPKLTDEQIYQQARSIVTAEIQSITYNQWLPALLGRGALPAYQGYDPTVNPDIANEFSTAAFRLGHSLINDDVEFMGNNGTPVRDEVSLKDAFFNPALLESTGIDGILKYAASTQSEELDNQIVDSLRNFLFGQPGQGGLDLASLNIQRGRDHGLADYNTTRAAYGLPRVTSFADITSDPAVQQNLQDLYGSVDNVDLWVGALAEDHAAGSSTGPLVKAILSDQFERLRDGDRYWFENIFSGRQLSQLENTTLADVIRRNTTTTNLQSNVFFMRASVSGQVLANTSGGHRFSFRASGVANVAVDLVNGDGVVVASTTTGRDGRYQFANIGETGNYQIRITAPTGMKLMSGDTRAVSITRGDVAVPGINFAVQFVNHIFGAFGGFAATSPDSSTSPTAVAAVAGGSACASTWSDTAPDSPTAEAVAFSQLASSHIGWHAIDTAALVDRSRPAADHDAALAALDSSGPSNGSVLLGGLGGLMGHSMLVAHGNPGGNWGRG